MGVAGTIIATLGSAYLQGQAERRQANARAAEAETNAEIAMRNSQKQQENAEQQAQNNAINEENKRRRLSQYGAKQRAVIGASGITATGSALMTLADTQYAQAKELAMDAYNGRQKVDEMVSQSNDMYNQGLIYKQNARDYRKAGKRAFMTHMLMGTLSLAGNLYSAGSAGAQSAKQAAGGFGDTKFNAATGKMGFSNTTWQNNAWDTAAGGDASLGGVFNKYNFGTKYNWG